MVPGQSLCLASLDWMKLTTYRKHSLPLLKQPYIYEGYSKELCQVSILHHSQVESEPEFGDIL